jgi:hypothetical protein
MSRDGLRNFVVNSSFLRPLSRPFGICVGWNSPEPEYGSAVAAF